jgi:thiamine pyrophosphokinase
MSSHHIVREKQEPALLVLGLDDFSDELLGQLLEWSPTVIATEQTAENLNAYGIKIDWIISDGGNDLQSDVKMMSVGNNPLISTTLKYLIAQDYSAVSIITDELNLDDYLPFADRINLVIFYKQQKIYAINSGFSKWKPAGEIVELLTPAHGLNLNGLEMIKNDQYKTIDDGFFTIGFDETFVFIAENL